MGKDLVKRLDTDLAKPLDASLTPFAMSPEETGAAHWWDPDASYITFNVGDVAAWLDRLGSKSVAQAVGGNQPTHLTTSPRFGHPAVDFDSASFQRLLLTDAALGGLFDGGSPFTMYVEHIADATGDGVCGASDSGAGGSGASIEYTSTDFVNRYSDGTTTHFFSGTPGADIGATTWGYIQSDGSTLTGGQRGGAAPSGAITAVPGLDTFMIGGRPSGVGVVIPFLGEIGHVAIWSRALSAGEHSATQAWIEGLWV